MNRRLLLMFVVLIAIVLAACAPPINLRDENNLKDTSLLSGDPCEAPCWNGIVPGETSFRDAMILVEDDARFTNVEEVELEDATDERLFSFAEGEGNTCCQVLSETGDIIDSMLLFLAPDMTIGEIIDKFGEPTYLLGDAPAEDQAFVLLVFPDVPLVVYAFVAGSAEGEISGSSEIIGALYSTDEAMQRLIDNNSFYDWDGYQPYTTYMDENYDFVGADVGSDDEASSDESESD